MTPTLEQLESRNCPAPLLAVTAAQLAALHDATGESDDVADVGQPVNLPVKDAVLYMPLPTDCQWFISGYNQLAVTIRDGLLEEAWYGVDKEMAQSLADDLNVPLLAPVLSQSPGKLTVTPELVNLLETAEVGQPMTHDWLAAQLGADPMALAAPGQPLQLAFATSDGWTVHTLTPGEDGWALASIDQVASLAPALGLWELRIAG